MFYFLTSLLARSVPISGKVFTKCTCICYQAHLHQHIGHRVRNKTVTKQPIYIPSTHGCDPPPPPSPCNQPPTYRLLVT